MKTVYYVPIEPIDSRYTKQWYTAIPDEIKKYRPELKVVTIDGDQLTGTTPGAFLDFAMTNVWKNDQLNKIARMFSSGEIKAGDVFLFADAWNSGIIQVKYMSELLNIPVTIHGIWHAGAYDPTDILGFTIKDKTWVHEFERSIYYACDYNWFGSNKHKNLFCTNLGVPAGKAFHSGQPHYEIIKNAKQIPIEEKEDIILFGHRISPDKQPDIFRDLAEELPQYTFVFSQSEPRTKEEYYDLIRKAKISFSANTHENFGISMVEAVFNGTVPLMPGRLSYIEMYKDEFVYPSWWTIDQASYDNYKELLIDKIVDIMQNYKQYHGYLEDQREFLESEYMNSKKMISKL